MLTVKNCCDANLKTFFSGTLNPTADETKASVIGNYTRKLLDVPWFFCEMLSATSSAIPSAIINSEAGIMMYRCN